MYHYQTNYIETIKNGKYWSKVLLKTVLTDMGHQKFRKRQITDVKKDPIAQILVVT